ncbi:MAG: dihydrolipoyl dehydrogenase family protein, partial [Candidatus Krumholzibacteriia bacterium]
ADTSLAGGRSRRLRQEDALKYDLAVLGGGAAGLTAAGLGANLGARTLLVERERLGGDCTWSGCVPSKALLKAAKVAHLARRAGDYGLEPAELGVDLAKVLNRVHAIQRHIYDEADRPGIYEGHGVAVRIAAARFIGPHELELSMQDGSCERVSFRHAVIATGSRPVVPPIQGLSDCRYHTNETLFHLEKLPGHLGVLGAGPIGMEMAQAFRRLGARVTVFERGRVVLPKDDPELTGVLHERLGAEGVVIHLGAEVTSIESTRSGLRVQFEAGGEMRAEEVDTLLVAAGRSPQVESLHLEAAGVRSGARGILVDAYCRTNRKHLYACGDVVGRLQFTHMAEHMAKVAVGHALLRLPVRLDTRAIPWVTYTDPEVAHVGARRVDLDRHGKRYRLYRFPFSKLDRAVVTGVPQGWVHVLATRWTGRILGASIVGENAGEMIAELGLALKHRIPLRKIADTVHAYPTFALGNRRAADQWYVQRASPLFVRLLQKVRGFHGRVPPAPDPERSV